MLQNKIYQNFIKEILKTFFVILFGLTVIAWTVKGGKFSRFNCRKRLFDHNIFSVLYFKLVGYINKVHTFVFFTIFNNLYYKKKIKKKNLQYYGHLELKN